VFKAKEDLKVFKDVKVFKGHRDQLVLRDQ
jgi:hypothetical protein